MDQAAALSPRERVAGAALCLGCYHSLWQWSQRGFSNTCVPQVDVLVPPWLGPWRCLLWGDAFTTTGLMWVFGMLALAGMFLMLAGRGGRLPFALLGLSGLATAFVYSGDFRIWSGYNNAQFLLIALFLLARPRLSALRAGLAASFMASGLTMALNAGVTPLAYGQLILPSLWWLLPWSLAATGPLALMLAWQGVQWGAELVMVMLLCLLAAEGGPLGWRTWALLIPGFLLCLGTGLGHPQMALDPERPHVRATYRVVSDSMDWEFAVELLPVGPGELRVVVSRGTEIQRAPWPAAGPVLIQPRYFQQAELAVQDPYLYQAYAEALAKRVESIELSLECADRSTQRWSWNQRLSPGNR